MKKCWLMAGVLAIMSIVARPCEVQARAVSKSRASKMNEAKMNTAEAFRLPDEAYYSNVDTPFDRLGDGLAPDPNQETAPPVFTLGLPHVIDAKRSGVVPGALLRRYSGLQQWQVDRDQNLSFIVVDLRTGATEVAKAFRTERNMDPPRPSRSTPEPRGIDRQAIHYGAERLTVPAVFGERWPSTTFAVTALLYDMVSNTVVLDRHPPAEGLREVTSAPSPFLEHAPAAHAPPAGFTLNLPAAVAAGDAITVTGAVNLPKAAVSIVRSTESHEGFVLVATLLLVALDAPRPVKVNLMVPVTTSGASASATFSFDLGRRPEGLGLRGEYQVYLISGLTVVGPKVLTVAKR